MTHAYDIEKIEKVTAKLEELNKKKSTTNLEGANLEEVEKEIKEFSQILEDGQKQLKSRLTELVKCNEKFDIILSSGPSELRSYIEIVIKLIEEIKKESKLEANVIIKNEKDAVIRLEDLIISSKSVPEVSKNSAIEHMLNLKLDEMQFSKFSKDKSKVLFDVDTLKKFKLKQRTE